MLDNQVREQIALKRFSLISPVINGQVDKQNQYFATICAVPIEMPHYGFKHYSPKTLECWLSEYRRGGIEALKPGYRSDKGRSRKVSNDLVIKIAEKRSKLPRAKTNILYEELVKDGDICPNKLSLSTFYRYLATNPELLPKSQDNATEDEPDLKRFSYEKVNQLWQADLMYGPYIRIGKQKKQTYLIAFIDDASRLVTYSEFTLSQNFLDMRSVLKEAVMRRGIPKMIYTDNGRIYRTQQLALICASFGCSVIHAEPFTPNSKGKIERFFKTVRTRFLSLHTQFQNLEELNELYWKWLNEDYHSREHQGIKTSPLDYYLKQANEVRLIADTKIIDEHFLLRVTRKVNHDATLSLESLLFETNQALAGKRVEVRYDPDWLSQPDKQLFLYIDSKKVGEAKLVNYLDNAYVKRRKPGKPKKEEEQINADSFPQQLPKSLSNTISFSKISNLGGEQNDNNPIL